MTITSLLCDLEILRGGGAGFVGRGILDLSVLVLMVRPREEAAGKGRIETQYVCSFVEVLLPTYLCYYKRLIPRISQVICVSCFLICRGKAHVLSHNLCCVTKVELL
jgi:hypothetical protein